MLRMLQAILMIVISQPLLTSGFTELVALGNKHVWVEPRVANVAVLVQLRSNVALARRFFRIFRFLESFHAAHVTYTSFYSAPPSTPLGAANFADNGHEGSNTVESERSEGDDKEKSTSQHTCPNPDCRRNHPRSPKPSLTRAPVEAWLDIFSRTFNGMYLLLEALTLLDALALPGGFSLVGREWASLLHVEGQRFWLFALVCGIGSAVVKLFKLIAYGPPPAEGYVSWPGSKQWEGRELAEWERQRERMRKMVWARREGRVLWMAEIRSRGWKIARRAVADGVDLVVPGSVVGWLMVAEGTVGWCMVLSTWLTGLEVWEKCGG